MSGLLGRYGTSTALTSRSLPPPSPAQPLLLVEDDALIRDVLLETLLNRGYEVVEAATGEDAARLMAGGLRPPVLVTDINLGPGCSGVELADGARARDPDMPIVFITGRLDMLRDRGARAGEFILPKPFALTAFLDLVGRLAAARAGMGQTAMSA